MNNNKYFETVRVSDGCGRCHDEKQPRHICETCKYGPEECAKSDTVCYSGKINWRCWEPKFDNEELYETVTKWTEVCGGHCYKEKQLKHICKTCAEGPSKCILYRDNHTCWIDPFSGYNMSKPHVVDLKTAEEETQKDLIKYGLMDCLDQEISNMSFKSDNPIDEEHKKYEEYCNLSQKRARKIINDFGTCENEGCKFCKFGPEQCERFEEFNLMVGPQKCKHWQNKYSGEKYDITPTTVSIEDAKKAENEANKELENIEQAKDIEKQTIEHLQKGSANVIRSTYEKLAKGVGWDEPYETYMDRVHGKTAKDPVKQLEDELYKEIDEAREKSILDTLYKLGKENLEKDISYKHTDNKNWYYMKSKIDRIESIDKQLEELIDKTNELQEEKQVLIDALNPLEFLYMKYELAKNYVLNRVDYEMLVKIYKALDVKVAAKEPEKALRKEIEEAFDDLFEDTLQGNGYKSTLERQFENGTKCNLFIVLKIKIISKDENASLYTSIQNKSFNVECTLSVRPISTGIVK